jgi:4-hydroxy-tetrahydrodipicolinate synthase
MTIKKEEVKGIVNFLITPFQVNDWRHLDKEGLRKNTKYQSDNGVQVLVPCGGLGEITQLTVEEHKKAIKTVVEESGKSLVIPGVGPSTKKGIHIGKYAEEVGADGVTIFRPDLVTLTQEGIYRHIKAIAEAINIAVVPISYPGSLLYPETVKKLSKIDNIVALKFEPGGNELAKFNDMVRIVGNKLAWIVLIHHKGQLAPYFHMAGADAYMDLVPNFAPQLVVEMYDSLLRKKYSKVKEIQLKLAPLIGLASSMGSKTFTKEAMNLVGLAGGSFRPPTLPATEEQKDTIRKELEKLNIL